MQCTGRNPARFLETLRRGGIPVLHAESKGRDTTLIAVSAKDFCRIRPAVRQCGCRVHIVEKHGLPFLLFRARFRPALVAGICAVLLLLAAASTRFCWIEVRGCERIPAQVILRALAEEGVKRFGALPAQNFQSVAARARMYDDRIAWISLEKKGATLIVKVTEHEPVVETVDSGTPCDVVAVKDGIIVRSEVYEGQSPFAPGDAVAAGDVLIHGEFFPDTKEEVAEPMRVHARGSITANVFYFAEFAAEPTKRALVETGNSVPYRAVQLDSWTLFETETPYAHFEITDVVSSPFSDAMLPVRRIEGVCWEQAEADVPVTEAEQVETALTNAEALAFLKIPKDAVVKEKKTAVIRESGCIVGIVGVVTEESIGLTREIGT